jgi:hypothetical protein
MNDSSTTPQPRKRHRVRNTILAGLGVITAIVIASSAASSGSSHPAAHDSGIGTVSGGSTSAPASGGGSTDGQAAAPAPAQAPVEQAKHVKFVITGYAPGGDYNTVDISYGSNNDNHDVTLPSLTGKVVYSVPFDSSADYYSVDASYMGTGHLAVKIVITGHSMNPTTVSHGHGSGAGEYSDVMASAQASANNPQGTQWMDES